MVYNKEKKHKKTCVFIPPLCHLTHIFFSVTMEDNKILSLL